MGSRTSNPLLGVASHQVHSALARLDDRNYSEFPPNFHPPICPKTIQNLFRNTKKMKKVPTTTHQARKSNPDPAPSLVIHYYTLHTYHLQRVFQLQPDAAASCRSKSTEANVQSDWSPRRWLSWSWKMGYLRSNSGRGYDGWMASG